MFRQIREFGEAHSQMPSTQNIFYATVAYSGPFHLEWLPGGNPNSLAQQSNLRFYWWLLSQCDFIIATIAQILYLFYEKGTRGGNGKGKPCSWIWTESSQIRDIEQHLDGV